MKPTRTKEQIINAYENTIVLKVISGLMVFGGIVSAVILAGRPDHTLTTIVLVGSFVGALIMTIFAIRCPICGEFMTHNYWEVGIVMVRKGSFRCDGCNLSSKQIGEYVDLLKRGIDIDGEVIARFNKRGL